MANPFCHVELHANGVDRAKEFYSNLFDWDIQDMPMGDASYSMVKVGQGTGGGIIQNPAPNSNSHWLSYVQVDDLTAATRRAGELGASVVQDVTEVPGFGRLSVIADPTGAVLGLWQPAYGN